MLYNEHWSHVDAYDWVFQHQGISSQTTEQYIISWWILDINGLNKHVRLQVPCQSAADNCGGVCQWASGDWQVRLDGTVDILTSTLLVRGQEVSAGTGRLVFHLSCQSKATSHFCILTMGDNWSITVSLLRCHDFISRFNLSTPCNHDTFSSPAMW